MCCRNRNTLPLFQARRLASHVRETIGWLALQRRVAKLNKRLQAAGLSHGSAFAGTSRPQTPSADTATAGHAGRGVSSATATSAHPCSDPAHEAAAGTGPGPVCTACTDMQQQVASLVQDVAAMHALLQRMCADTAVPSVSAPLL